MLEKLVYDLFINCQQCQTYIRAFSHFNCIDLQEVYLTQNIGSLRFKFLWLEV